MPQTSKPNWAGFALAGSLDTTTNDVPPRCRRVAAGALVLACVIAGHLFSARPASGQTVGDTPGLSRLLAASGGAGLTRGIATFDAVPGATQVAALRGLGLAVQPMRHVPLAVIHGTMAAMETAVATGVASDVYPDEPVELFDTASSNAMGAATTRAAGLTGAGVTVAVVDSGCDASHPDLADHVVHNVKLYSGEYANIRPDGSNTIVVPYEMGPYQNSDLGGGHGTHVAGIIAADSTTDPAGGRLGVAPDARARLLLDRRGSLHDRGRHGLRPPARPTGPLGRGRGEQFLGQLFPPVRSPRPGGSGHEGGGRPRGGGRLRGREQWLRERGDEPQSL